MTHELRAMAQTTQWRVWQMLDSAFPTGGFAHSGGLEAAWQQGWIHDGQDVRQFVLESLRQAVWGAAPFVSAAHAESGTAEAARLDGHLDAMLANHVANRASRLQGHALAATAEKVFGGAVLAGVRRAIAEGRRPGHQAVVFGEALACLGLAREEAVRMFLFGTVRGVISAAVRLGAVGPLEGQMIQAGLGAQMEELLQEGLNLTVQDAAQCAPALELWQMSQDRLYSRLFQS